MKKKLFIFIFVLVSIPSFSQLYRLKIYDYNFYAWTSDGRCGTNELWIDVGFFDGTSSRIYGAYPESYSNSVLFDSTFSKRVTSIYFHTFIHEKGGFPRDCNGDTGSLDITRSIPVVGCIYAGNLQGRYASGDVDTAVNFNFSVSPEISLIQETNDLIGFDDILSVSVTANSLGFSPLLYNWQYQLVSPGNPILDNSWVNMPITTSGNPSFNILISSFLNSTSIGKRIYLRINKCGSLYTQNISYKIVKSTAHILSIIKTETTCNYTNDGRVKITLDRPLYPDEKLGYELKFDNGSNSFSYPADGSLVLDGTNSFEIINLQAKVYSFRIFSFNNSDVNYSDGVNHKANFEIKKPDPVDFSLSKVDVWCHGGNDGSITINATGGNVLDATANGVRYYYSVNNGNWMPFSTETSHTLSNLLPGPYTIKVRDFKSCYARTPQDTDKEATESITQPASPVSLAYTQVLQPTFYGGTNGRLVAAIQGGTRFSDNSYQYEWRNSSNVLQTNVTPFYDAGAATYYLTLNGIPSDTYTLTVRDKNFSSATNQVGCTVANSPQFLGQPDPIVVTLQVTKTISCHVANSFGDETDFDPTDGQRDESQDGIILATVTGGVPFTGFDNNGLPYKYYWTKEAANGTWVAWNDMDETAENLSHGNYAINVEDKNGIRLGVYVNNVLDQETPKIQFMQQPDKFELTFQKGDITCSSGSNGWLTAVPTGGTAPYFYEWTTGATTAQITNLIANNYFVKVTDSKGCIVQGSSTVEQPNGVAIQEVLTNPTCTSGSDGSIQIDITGGTLPYLYTWSTGQTTKDLTNLTAGNYTLTLEDGQGCTYFKDFVLTDPVPIVVNLGNDRTLCNGQNLELDVTISDALAQYSWTSSNGFTSTSPLVSLTNSGTYQCKVTSSKGCEASDTITISTSNVTISSEFFLSSQAYLNEEVVLVNTSNPLGQNTIWDIPNTVTIVSQNENYIVLKFPAVGSYTISLKQTQGDCYAIYSKLITVEPKTINASIGNTSNPFISEFSVSPNPSSGDFSAIIKLEESSPIKLRLYALSGQVPLIEKYETGQKNYVVPFSINLAAGTYALILETAKQTLVKKIIIY